jgi:ketosteroid isomerase-like protein
MSGPEHVVRAAIERVNADDFAGYYELMADGIVMVTETRALTGKPAVTAELDASFKFVSNNWMRVDRLVVSGDHVATWLTVGGATVKSGVPWQVEGCTVWKVREGSITSILEYYDWGPLLRALGMRSDV